MPIKILDSDDKYTFGSELHTSSAAGHLYGSRECMINFSMHSPADIEQPQFKSQRHAWLQSVRTRPKSIRDTGEMKKERSEMDTGAARSPKDTTKEENSI